MLKKYFNDGFVYLFTLAMVSAFLGITFVGVAYLATLVYYLIF